MERGKGTSDLLTVVDKGRGRRTQRGVLAIERTSSLEEERIIDTVYRLVWIGDETKILTDSRRSSCQPRFRLSIPFSPQFPLWMGN